MGNPIDVKPGEGANPSSPGPQPPSRAWSVDDLVVIAFAFLGFGGGVFLPLQFGFNHVPPITTSFLLATGLAALTYRFLGGVQGASFAVGSLKLGGALAALAGIALLINNSLVKQVQHPAPPPSYQVWAVSGQVVNASGKAIDPLDPTDIELSPPTSQLFPAGKFRLVLYSMPSNTISPFPTLTISHSGYVSDSVDLNPTATTNNVQITRSGQNIAITQIPLQPLAPYQPPQQALKQVPYAAEAAAASPESHP